MSLLAKDRAAALSPEPRFESPGFLEFVLLVALLMAVGAFSIDNIMPAFGPIHDEFGVASTNDLQLMMTVYMAGFAVMQLVYGPISDMIGRRPTLMIGMAIYLLASAAALMATDYPQLLAARVGQGMGAACTRVLTVALVRDRFAGREMARVMSLTMMIFIIVPIFAPAIGGLILAISGWRAIFGAMIAFALVLTVWFGLRMPETLKPEYRQPISATAMANAFRRTATTRVAIGYSTCMAIMFGCVMSYINSAQQIFETEVYGLGRWFPLAFGSIAAVMGVASFLNSRLVAKVGMRRLAHGGAVGFTLVALLQFLSAWMHGGHPPLAMFALTMAGCHFLFALVAPNVNAMAMEPLGDIAGTASSFMGFYTTLLGAVFGYFIGQSFDGTVIPLSLGYLLLGAATVAVMLWTERGALFRPHPSAPATDDRWWCFRASRTPQI